MYTNTDCKSLVQLSLSCKRMASGVDKVATQMLALQNKNVRYGGDNCDEDLAVLEELNYLRSPLTFTHLLGNRIDYLENDKSCIWSSNTDTSMTPSYLMANAAHDMVDWSGSDQTAICSDYVMTSGKHYAKFYIDTSSNTSTMFRFFYSKMGLMRPISSDWKEDAGWAQFNPIYNSWFNDFLEHKTDAWGKSDIHTCFYYDYDGTAERSNWDQDHKNSHQEIPWDGMKGYSCFSGEKIGQIGLLLDLDEGTLTVYKDGKRLGIMMRGLTGEYCWVLSVLAQGHGCPHQQNVRIERAPIPTTDTDQTFRPVRHTNCECGIESDDESMCSCCGAPRRCNSDY